MDFEVGKIYQRIKKDFPLLVFTDNFSAEIHHLEKIIVLDLYATNGVKFLFDGKIYHYELSFRNWYEVSHV